MKTITEVLNRLREKHYIHDFEISHQKLVCKDTNECFGPNEVTLDKTFRFEGDSNPDDMSVLFALSTPSGSKGVLIDAYGTYSNADVAEFIKHVPLKEESEAA